LYLTFLSKPNGFKLIIIQACDSSYYICTSLGFLALPSIFIGFYFKDMAVGIGSDFWGNAIYTDPQNMNLFDAEFLNPFFKIVPVIVSLSGVFLAFLFYSLKNKILFKLKFSSIGKKIYNFLNKKWFFDKIYNEQIGQSLFNFSYGISYKTIDRGIFEIAGPHGVSVILLKFASTVSQLQTGNIYHYTFVYLVGLTVLLGFRYAYLFVSFYYCSIWFFYLTIFLIFFSTFTVTVKLKDEV